MIPSARVSAQSPQNPPADAAPLTIERLTALLAEHEARIRELEAKLAARSDVAPVAQALTPAPPAPAAPGAATPAAPISAADLLAQTPEPAAMDMGGHTMELPGGGPNLKIRGFFDFNLGFGSDANPLIFPLPQPVHNTFQSGEFDLFVSSQLAEKLSFVSEIIFGSDATNNWGLDIERAQLTYRPSRYFEISGGRYHTSIGYYNTAFHHGTWFQTATGRPFMYFFEDSGGILPVHGLGVTTTGLVPGTGRLNLHWVAEVSNGRASSLDSNPVQNFLSDKNHKAFNVAAYIRPEAINGLQIGGSYYRDRMVPAGLPDVNQNIESLYVVYSAGAWELLNEAVLLSNHMDGSSRTFHTPLLYTQAAYRVHQFRPYFRYQYVNAPAGDPVNIYAGRYEGPSAGLRIDLSTYAAWKIQYNRLFQRNVPAANGVDMQVAFTF